MVTIAAQGNEVLLAVTPGSAARDNVMDIELLTAPTPLAAPAIAPKNLLTQLIVGVPVLS